MSRLGTVKGLSALATTRAMTVGLWALVGVGAVAGTAAFLRPAPRPEKPKLPEVTTAHEGIAQLFVATWLRGGGRPNTGLEAYFPGATPAEAQLDLNPPPPVDVLRTVAVDPRVISPGYVAVTVAVEQGEAPTAAEPAPVSTHFYRADILRVDRAPDGTARPSAYVATALPFEVAAPLGSRLPDLALARAVKPSATDAMSNRLSRFLAALLTGQGEVTDYTSPGASIRPVRPAPFVSVVLIDIAAHATGEANKATDVLVTATVTDRAGRTLPVSYPLSLTSRANRWEVALIRQAPPLADTQPDLAPAPTTPTSLPATTAVPSTTTPRAPTSTTPQTSTTSTTPRSVTTTTGRNPL